MAVSTFHLPDLGEGLEDAEVLRWHVAVGDRVELNDVLCTVETAKAEVDLPSPFAGTVVELGVAAGEVVAVGAALVRVETAPSGAAPADDGASRPNGSGAARAVADGREPLLVGYGADDSSSTSRRRRLPRRGKAADPSAGAGASRPLASPAVRRLAAERGVDLAAVARRTGPEGSITRADLESHLSTTGPDAPPAPVAASPDRGDADVIEVRGVRARVADAMARSHLSIPTAGAGRWVDCTALMAARDARRDAAAPEVRRAITPFGLIARIVVAVLRDHPDLNATFDADERVIRRFRGIHLGVAVDTPRGLLVPVIRDADRLSTTELLAALQRVAHAGRAGALPPVELVGSTFSISNFGAFGLDDGWPMVNPPEAAIVGVGAVRERAVAVDGALAVRPTVKLTCTFDHRVADGAQVGGFLAAVAGAVEAADGLDG